MEENNEISEQKSKNHNVLWFLIILLVIIGIGGGYAYFVFNKSEKNNNTTADSTKTTTNSNNTTISENWVVNSEILKTNTTSSDTHKIAEGLYRMYYMDQGQIYYADSVDCKTFSTGMSTGIKEVSGKMVSNPAVLQVSDGNWIMIYEMAPIRQPGQQNNSTPGVSNQRNLYLATSLDGKNFTAVGIAIDSSKEDRYFASVPDLVAIPDGKIRMYYVSQGDAIGSAISSDNGITWTRESGFRLKNMAVDPDVIIKTENGTTKWVMYYSVLDPAKNAMYKAVSTDGLIWNNETKIFGASTGGAIVDPDVVEITSTDYIMFLGQSTQGGSTGGEEINLYRAELKQSIF